MGSGASLPVPYGKNPIPLGKTRIGVAGFKVSPYTGKARKMAHEIATRFPDKYETLFYFDSSDNYYKFLKEKFDPVPFPPHLKGHSSSPFVWIERGAEFEITPIGGCDHFKTWILANAELAADKTIRDMAEGSAGFGDVFHNGSDAPQSTANVAHPPAAAQ